MSFTSESSVSGLFQSGSTTTVLFPKRATENRCRNAASNSGDGSSLALLLEEEGEERAGTGARARAQARWGRDVHGVLRTSSSSTNGQGSGSGSGVQSASLTSSS